MALSVDLGGAFDVDHEVASVVAATAAVFAGSGAMVLDAHPDLREADETFRTLRAWHLHAKFGRLLAEHPDSFKQSLADNIRLGETLTGPDIARAYTQRTTLSERMRTFFQSYDVLVLPAAQVPPFPVEQEFPTEINGQPMASYLDWMQRGVPHHRHRLPGDLGARRPHRRWLAGRDPDRGATRRRPTTARSRQCIRDRDPVDRGHGASLVHRRG